MMHHQTEMKLQKQWNDWFQQIEPQERCDAVEAMYQAFRARLVLELHAIAKQFREGYVSCIQVKVRDIRKSVHWLAGWDAGYEARKQVGNATNEYLLSINMELIDDGHVEMKQSDNPQS